MVIGQLIYLCEYPFSELGCILEMLGFDGFLECHEVALGVLSWLHMGFQPLIDGLGHLLHWNINDDLAAISFYCKLDESAAGWVLKDYYLLEFS